MFHPKSAAAALFAAPPEGTLADETPPAPAPLFFFQTPPNLPLARDGRPAGGQEYLASLASGSEATSDAAKTGGPAALTELSAGQLGELIVRRSGKVTLRIGDHLLDVTSGTACSIDQEVVAMSIPQQVGQDVHLHRLGKLHERLIITPDLDHLLSSTTAQPSTASRAPGQC